MDQDQHRERPSEASPGKSLTPTKQNSPQRAHERRDLYMRYESIRAEHSPRRFQNLLYRDPLISPHRAQHHAYSAVYSPSKYRADRVSYMGYESYRQPYQVSYGLASRYPMNPKREYLPKSGYFADRYDYDRRHETRHEARHGLVSREYGRYERRQERKLGESDRRNPEELIRKSRELEKKSQQLEQRQATREQSSRENLKKSEAAT